MIAPAQYDLRDWSVYLWPSFTLTPDVSLVLGNQAKIHQAMSDIQSAGGGELVFPPTGVLFTETITLAPGVRIAGRTMMEEGSPCVVYAPIGTGPVFLIGPNSTPSCQYEMRDITVGYSDVGIRIDTGQGGGAVPSVYMERVRCKEQNIALSVAGMERFRFVDCCFQATHGDSPIGMFWDDAYNDSASIPYISQGVFDNCNFSGQDNSQPVGHRGNAILSKIALINNVELRLPQLTRWGEGGVGALWTASSVHRPNYWTGLTISTPWNDTAGSTGQDTTWAFRTGGSGVGVKFDGGSVGNVDLTGTTGSVVFDNVNGGNFTIQDPNKIAVNRNSQYLLRNPSW